MNKKICICGYQGTSFFPSKLIRWITWSKYSHIAIMFPSEGGIAYEAWHPHGVRKVQGLSDQHSKGTVVDVKILHPSPFQYDIILKALESQLGKGYDWKGCLRFLPSIRPLLGSHFSRSELAKWFCSELGMWAVQEQGGMHILDKEASKTSPADMMTTPEAIFFSSYICGVQDYKNFLEKLINKGGVE